MLKKLIVLSILTLLCGLPNFADTTIRVEIDGEPLLMEVAPQIENSRALVPFKAIFEGLDLKIDWNSALRIATAYNEDMNVSIKLDALYGNINGELFELDVAGKIVAGRTLVPVKFISEAFGNEIKWDEDKRLISIKSGFKPVTYTENLPTVDSYDKLKLIFDYAGKYTNYINRTLEDTMATPAMMDKGDSAMEQSSAPEAAPTADTDYSTTNIQVEGVDEADIVKTDGKTIYQLRATDLKITDASTGTMKTLATLKFEDLSGATEFYLSDNKLIVIGSKQIYYSYPVPVPVDIQPDAPTIEKMAPSIMPMQTPKTVILFYDVTNPANPTLIRRYESDGSYMTSRLTGGKLYMIINKYFGYYGPTEESVLPTFTDTKVGVDSQSVKTSQIGYEGIKYFPDTIESNLMITLGFDLDLMEQEPYKAAYLGNSTNVYANMNTLVVAMNRYHYDFGVMPDRIEPAFLSTTELYKFDLLNGAINFSAKGSVPGSVLNQFSMDAYDGNYRIATTTGETWAGTSTNNLYVLDAGLQLIGKLEGLAPTERIYSARFLGERAYLVTFRQVDPFYVIDLKDPTAPKVLGFLKIPGFSDYLHPYDANTIIGFGRETIETANGPIQGGLKISMFDVTDVANPTEKSKVVLGSSGSWSEALYNHKALMFSKEKSLFALPVLLYSGLGTENRFSFQGAYVYSIDAVNGFVLKGTSTHLTQPEVDDSILKWYDTSKNVSRILWIGDSLYTLSEYGIKSHDLNTMVEKEFMIY